MPRNRGEFVMADQKPDAELEAIATLLTVLEPLNRDARANVIEYVFKRLGITATTTTTPKDIVPSTPSVSQAPEILNQKITHLMDIRSFREAKQPRTSSEMVALVAYYLAHLTHGDEKREVIVADDVQKYFHQADFPLPGAPRMALVHAKNAGYLDARDRGQYRLNPVGHN